MIESTRSRLSVLFLCTRNAARSQMAEALMTHKVQRLAPGRFVVASAGSHPGEAVHPMAVQTLSEYGIDWSACRPKGIDEVLGTRWDLLITVCDRAKETCPTVPGQPAFAHWGMDDPSDVVDDEEQARRAFRTTLAYLSRRIDLLLALPFESLERAALQARVQHIADDVPVRGTVTDHR